MSNFISFNNVLASQTYQKKVENQHVAWIGISIKHHKNYLIARETGINDFL